MLQHYWCLSCHHTSSRPTTHSLAALQLLWLPALTFLFRKSARKCQPRGVGDLFLNTSVERLPVVLQFDVPRLHPPPSVPLLIAHHQSPRPQPSDCLCLSHRTRLYYLPTGAHGSRFFAKAAPRCGQGCPLKARGRAGSVSGVASPASTARPWTAWTRHGDH